MTQANGVQVVEKDGPGVVQTAAPAVPSVYVAMPSYDGRVEAEAAAAWLQHPTRGRCRVGQFFHRGSLLAYGFNYLWTQALNMAARGECDRFAMLHADINPEPGCPWVDVLEDVLRETGADVASVVVPIKDVRGLTSTRIGIPADPWHTVKRLTMREVMALPETFRAADCGYPGHVLGLNTGCWMARLDRGDWQREVWFEIRDRIVSEAGELRAECLPEDWYWSHQLHRLGVDAVATRRVKVRHVGRIDFVNDQAWGSCAVDPLYTGEKGEVG